MSWEPSWKQRGKGCLCQPVQGRPRPQPESRALSGGRGDEQGAGGDAKALTGVSTLERVLFISEGGDTFILRKTRLSSKVFTAPERERKRERERERENVCVCVCVCNRRGSVAVIRSICPASPFLSRPVSVAPPFFNSLPASALSSLPFYPTPQKENLTLFSGAPGFSSLLLRGRAKGAPALGRAQRSPDAQLPPRAPLRAGSRNHGSPRKISNYFC